MFHQSNLALRSAVTFDPSRNTCHGDIILAPPGILIIGWATIMIQALGLDLGLYSLHSLRWGGGGTLAYRAKADLLKVKCHGLSASNAFCA